MREEGKTQKTNDKKQREERFGRIKRKRGIEEESKVHVIYNVVGRQSVIVYYSCSGMEISVCLYSLTYSSYIYHYYYHYIETASKETKGQSTQTEKKNYYPLL